jgi:hypothetical protein
MEKRITHRFWPGIARKGLAVLVHPGGRCSGHLVFSKAAASTLLLEPDGGGDFPAV